jgi:DNA excision repair protein ERCC-3
MNLFNERNWGLIIYDEVHLLPAPVFRATADIQATRRLGLTATLVREDGREGDVFSLIGPKCYDLPWKVLERQGWIAAVDCTEVIVPMDERLRQQYIYAGAKEQFRLAAGNQAKAAAAASIAAAHAGAAILVIGQYLDQLEQLAETLGAPLITGKTTQKERSALYAAFNEGRLPLLVVSKVANFAVNLPDASVAIEVSGAFGSRQEEAQRLGRILRPKPGDNKAYFYTLVSGDSREQEFALRRRMFLTEQGYDYAVRMLESAEEAIL